MHHSAPLHKARSVTTSLAEKNITVLPWPGNSPDMNPIENMWELTKPGIPSVKQFSVHLDRNQAEFKQDKFQDTDNNNNSVLIVYFNRSLDGEFNSLT